MVASAQAQDVSNFQGHYNWVHARASIPNLVLGICRVTQGLGGAGTNSPDPDASWDWGQLTAAKLDRGGYHFFDPRLDGAAQARYFVDSAAKLPGGIGPHDQFWLDNETANGVVPAIVAERAVAFMDELDKLVPRNPRGVYTFINFAREGYCAGLGNRWLWLAYPSSKVPVDPPPWQPKEFVLWQWGMRDGTDADAFMGTVPEYHAWVQGFAVKQAPGGMYRHTTTGTESLGEIAARRHAHPLDLVRQSADTYSAKDMGELMALPLPKGLPYYTENP
jgi:GH25 family lysozyme M1 (1,4-beta-N-acetylmuramidase)